MHLQVQYDHCPEQTEKALGYFVLFDCGKRYEKSFKVLLMVVNYFRFWIDFFEP